ncbi:MAG: hypothetical protein IPK63_19115 [Candidatus Competibacteraceae bacterium]|nr:hypothetical protein [Candidatus Competibacteraceae bacterium]
MSEKYSLHTHSLIVKRVGLPIYCEEATTVSIDDEGGGLFVELSQHHADGRGLITVVYEEWPLIVAAVNAMFEEIAKIEAEDK